MFREHNDGFIPFEEICRNLDASSKEALDVIDALKKEGYTFEADDVRGYRLLTHPDTLTRWEIASRLDTYYIGRFLDAFYRVSGSTNDMLKELADAGAPEGTCIVADIQEGGKGRRGREWVTPPPGSNIAMSILLRPRTEPDRLSSITLAAAMAVRQAVEDMLDEAEGQEATATMTDATEGQTGTGMTEWQDATAAMADGAEGQASRQVLIKWPNDVVFNGGKLTGILTELSMKEGAVSYVVVGIGINVNNEDFPEDLRGKATSMYLETGRKWSRAELTARIFSCFEVLYGRFEAEGFASLSREYEKQLAGLGKKAVVMERKPWTGTVTGVNEDGALLIADEAGQIHVISSGEISIRGINGYSP
jgi:BirA family biotin operon repressor/biotin-[acetyl-CoA-carboxylase] ligase